MVVFFLFLIQIQAQFLDQFIPIETKVSGEVASGHILITPRTIDSESDYPNSLYVLDSVGNILLQNIPCQIKV